MRNDNKRDTRGDEGGSKGTGVERGDSTGLQYIGDKQTLRLTLEVRGGLSA